MRALALALACGCGGAGTEPEPDGGATPDAGPIDLAGPCPLDRRVGEFKIAHGELSSAITGDVREDVIPNTVLRTEYEEDECRLLRRLNPFCDPPCAAGETCDLDKTCVPYPVNRSVGAVVVTGLRTDVTLTPNPANQHYEETDVDHPPFDPGATIRLTAAGGELEGFTLEGVGVEPIAVPDAEWVMVAGEPFDVAWTAADGPGEIHVTLNVDQHGNSPVTMFCDFEDTGSAAIAAALVDRLIEYGVSGAAEAYIFRRTVDSVEIAPGCVELATYSHLRPPLRLEDGGM